jgi:tRNA threonylcarbamoyladenosine biosynthesis protein TsaE
LVKAVEFITASPVETQALAGKIARTLKPGTIILLTGELGAGKTTFIQGLAKGLGAKENVSSPSFVLINEYRSGRIPLIHLDLYRLDNLAQIEELGLEDYYSQPIIMVIEWGEKLEHLAPKNAYKIELESLGEKKRKICISPDLAARLKK